MHGNFLDVPNFSHSHISQSQWRNREIIFDTGFLGYLNYTTQLFCKLFPTQLTSIHIWNPTNLIFNLLAHYLQNQIIKISTIYTYLHL